MKLPPCRITELINTLESGQSITQQQVNRIATLQALDLVKIGRDTAREALELEQVELEDLVRREQEKRHVNG